MIAAMFDRVDILDLLLAYGADPSLVDDGGMTAKAAAEMTGAAAAVERLSRP